MVSAILNGEEYYRKWNKVNYWYKINCTICTYLIGNLKLYEVIFMSTEQIVKQAKGNTNRIFSN